MNCPTCQHENRPAARFCAGCGARLQRVCPECGSQAAPDEGAVLVNRLLRAMVDVLVTYQGRVDRFLGDGLLAVFGATQAHENDPERAIRAAIEIRQAAAELGLEVTAGINTGDVYVGE